MLTKSTLIYLSQKYGTPTFIFDADEVINRANEIKSILGDVPLCYSIKANPHLITVLIDTVDLFEVCSPGELEICKHLNVPPCKIIYSGVNKGCDDVCEAIKYGVKTLTAESLRHIELIKNESLKQGKKVDVLLRLTSNSQFGMSLEDIKYVLANPNENINIVGIHYFAGTQRSKLKKQREELEMLKEVFEKLRKEFNIELPKLEYGPGLPYPYFEGDDFTDTLSPLKELSNDLKLEWCHLSVEMGRFLASSCGYYMTGIADLKKSSDHNWCILDGGLNHLNYLGQMMGMKVPVINNLSKDPTDESLTSNSDNNQLEEYTLCGSLCTTNDILVRSYNLSNPQIDDVLVFCNAGAYTITEGIYLFLSRTMPKVVIYKNGCDTLVRDNIESWKINIGNI